MEKSNRLGQCLLKASDMFFSLTHVVHSTASSSLSLKFSRGRALACQPGNMELDETGRMLAGEFN